MSGFEWFLLVVVVIAVPLIVAVMVTLWTLEQARMRNRKNREASAATPEPVKRRAAREANEVEAGTVGGAAAESVRESDGEPANRDATAGEKERVSRET